MTFKLDKRLEADSSFVLRIKTCQIRLINDARYPWCVLVPEIEGAVELNQVEWEFQLDILHVSNLLSDALQSVYMPHKLNVSYLGNIVKQLHIHHVARFEYDATWPKPIWGHGEAKAYSDAALNIEINKIKQALVERC